MSPTHPPTPQILTINLSDPADVRLGYTILSSMVVLLDSLDKARARPQFTPEEEPVPDFLRQVEEPAAKRPRTDPLPADSLTKMQAKVLERLPPIGTEFTLGDLDLVTIAAAAGCFPSTISPTVSRLKNMGYLRITRVVRGATNRPTNRLERTDKEPR